MRNHRLTVSKDRATANTYFVLIGRTKVGWVRKKEKDTRTNATSFTYIPEIAAFPHRNDVPAILIAPTMTEIRERLTERISAETCTKILEAERGDEG